MKILYAVKCQQRLINNIREVITENIVPNYVGAVSGWLPKLLSHAGDLWTSANLCILNNTIFSLSIAESIGI